MKITQDLLGIGWCLFKVNLQAPIKIGELENEGCPYSPKGGLGGPKQANYLSQILVDQDETQEPTFNMVILQPGD